MVGWLGAAFSAIIITFTARVLIKDYRHAQNFCSIEVCQFYYGEDLVILWSNPSRKYWECDIVIDDRRILYPYTTQKHKQWYTAIAEAKDIIDLENIK